jgi:hypothetical protein
VVVRIHATDALGNESRSAQAAVSVTRLRWEYDTGGTGVTESAIDLAQRVAFGVTGAPSGPLRIVRPGCDPVVSPQACVTEVSLGAGVELAAAPMIGLDYSRVWSSTTNQRLVGWQFGTGNIDVSCQLAGVATGPAASLMRTPDMVVSNTGADNFMYATGATVCGAEFAPGVTSTLSPVVAGTGRVYSAMKSPPSLRAYIASPASGALAQAWFITLGEPLAPLAIDRQDRVLVLAGDGTLHRVTDTGSSGSATVLASGLGPGSTVSPIVLRDDSIVVAGGATLTRLDDAGATLWSRALPASVTGVIATVPDASGVALYVTTADGALRALRLDGSDAWDGPAQLAPTALGSPNVGGQESTRFLYVGGADGKLRAVVIDQDLDFTAPWPKPYRDEQNSSRAR